MIVFMLRVLTGSMIFLSLLSAFHLFLLLVWWMVQRFWVGEVAMS